MCWTFVVRSIMAGVGRNCTICILYTTVHNYTYTYMLTREAGVPNDKYISPQIRKLKGLQEYSSSSAVLARLERANERASRIIDFHKFECVTFTHVHTCFCINAPIYIFCQFHFPFHFSPSISRVRGHPPGDAVARWHPPHHPHALRRTAVGNILDAHST